MTTAPGPTPTGPTNDDKDLVLSAFANHMLIDFEMAMDRFFMAVERRMRRDELTTDQVSRALDLGYGADISEAWDDWIEETDV